MQSLITMLQTFCYSYSSKSNGNTFSERRKNVKSQKLKKHKTYKILNKNHFIFCPLFLASVLTGFFDRKSISIFWEFFSLFLDPKHTKQDRNAVSYLSLPRSKQHGTILCKMNLYILPILILSGSDFQSHILHHICT